MKYKEKQMLEAIKGSGGDISEVAKRLGCARSTVYCYLDRYPAVYEALEEEREVLLDIAEYGLMKRVEDGDLRAIIFTLKETAKLQCARLAPRC